MSRCRDRNSASNVFVGLALLCCVGCASILAPRPDPTHFFILNATVAPSAAAAVSSAKPEAVALGPIGFPDYLARADIVTRTADNRIELAANDRWAEPLDVTFKRVLAIDLSWALHGASVTAFPSFGAEPTFRYRVAPVIDRFETGADGAAHLAARWTVIDTHDGRVLYATSSDISVPGGAGAAARAAALSQATDQFANQIATIIRQLGPQR